VSGCGVKLSTPLISRGRADCIDMIPHPPLHRISIAATIDSIEIELSLLLGLGLLPETI
jgi:hypothetical protein